MAIYSATKFAVNAATEASRQEFTRQSVRFSLVEPGATATELFEHKPGPWEGFTAAFGEVERLHAEDIATAVAFIVTNPRRVAINEILVRPTACVLITLIDKGIVIPNLYRWVPP